MNITITIRNFFSRRILKNEYFLRCSLIYIFSISFPLFSLQKSIIFLNDILSGLTKAKYFQRYYLYIILKSVVQYYLVNLENENFPDLTFQNVQNYSQLIKGFLVSNEITPNEDMFLLLKKCLSNKIIKNDDNNKKDIKNNFVFHTDKKNEEIINQLMEKNIVLVENVIEKKNQKLIFNYNNIKVECNILIAI